MLQGLVNAALRDEVSGLQAKLGSKDQEQEQQQLELALHQAQVSLSNNL